MIPPAKGPTTMPTTILLKGGQIAMATNHAKKIIKMCDPVDLVTQDLILEITAQEQAHRRQFIGFLYEYERSEAKRLTAAAA
jgi:ferritin-like protein